MQFDLGQPLGRPWQSRQMSGRMSNTSWFFGSSPGINRTGVSHGWFDGCLKPVARPPEPPNN